LCDGELLQVTKDFEIESPITGEEIVPGIEFEVCQECGDTFLLPSMGNKIAEYVREKEQTAIGQIPFDEFITAKEAIEILGFTKQALSKKASEVKNGLIMSRMKDGRRYFVEKSVELFKECGDGRYQLQFEKDFKIVLQAESKSVAKTKTIKEYVTAPNNLWTKTVRSESQSSNSSEVLDTLYDFRNA